MNTPQIRFLERERMNEFYADNPINKVMAAAISRNLNKSDESILTAFNMAYYLYVDILTSNTSAASIQSFLPIIMKQTDDVDLVLTILLLVLSLMPISDKVSEIKSAIKDTIRNQFTFDTIKNAVANSQESANDVNLFSYAFDFSFVNTTNWKKATKDYSSRLIRRYVKAGTSLDEQSTILNLIASEYLENKSKGIVIDVDFSKFNLPINSLAQSIEAGTKNLTADVARLQQEKINLEKRNAQLAEDITKHTSIPIQMLIDHAMKLDKDQATTVLKLLKSANAKFDQNWNVLIQIALDECASRPTNNINPSHYRIAKDQQTTFVKLMKVICQTHIFETTDGKIVSNVEDFIRDVAAFLNTSIKNPSSLLSAARKTDNFMAIFDTIHKYAYEYYTKDDGLSNSNQKYSQGEIF